QIWHSNGQRETLPKPAIILVVGVNGTGKTTSIGKLAHVYRSQGKKLILAAADTFRAAAIDQLKARGQRTGGDVVAQKQGAERGPGRPGCARRPNGDAPGAVLHRGGRRGRRRVGEARRRGEGRRDLLGVRPAPGACALRGDGRAAAGPGAVRAA